MRNSGIFSLHPDAKSIAFAAIYGIKSQSLTRYVLSDYLTIEPQREEYNSIYNRYHPEQFVKPDFYLIGVSTDNRYCMTSRKTKSIEDAVSSFTLAHQAMCIFHNAPYKIGTILGIDYAGSGGKYIISQPSIFGKNWELEGDIYRPEEMVHSYNYPNQIREYGEELKEFFYKFSQAYIDKNDKRWALAAHKFSQGINERNIENAILDLSVSMESLLAEGRDQINFKMRLFLALLVGETFEEREKIFKTVKVFYDLRSSLVHGGKMKKSDDKMRLVEDIGSYLSKALIKTCGMSIEDDLYKELEYMFLLGAPRLTREKITVVITERDIVDVIIRKHNIKNHSSYKARLSSDRRPDYKELLINMVFNNEESHTFYAATYLSDHDKIKGNGMISYWLSKEKGIGYLFYVTFDK